MDKDDQLDSYDKMLLTSLQRALEFLKYAEAKNAALLTFASAWILAMIGFQARERPLPAAVGPTMWLAIALLLVAGAITLRSFFPSLNLRRFLAGEANPAHNLLYFSDIASLNQSAFKASLKERYYPTTGSTARQEYLDDLVAQIWVNSRIVRSKLRHFSVAIIFVALAGLTMAYPVIAWIIEYLKTGAPR